jgi:hypothetical protein
MLKFVTDITFYQHNIMILKSLIGLLVVCVCVLSACSKEDLADEYIPQNLVRNGSFEDASMLDELWASEGDGYVVSNTNDSYEGARSLELGAFSCRKMTYEEAIPVVEGTRYELSFAIKMNGTATDCAGEFVLSITQGDEELLYFNISPETAPGWNIQKYYIEPISDLPLELEYIVGMDKLLLDDMQLKEVVAL